MPFYIALKRNRRNVWDRFLIQIKKSCFLIIQTLQVRIQYLRKSPPIIRKKSDGKKAFLSPSASLTLEASLVLPLFIFVVVCMILPMYIMNTERKLQASLESAGEDLSRYSYLKYVMEEEVPFLIEGAAIGYVQLRVMQQVDTSAVVRLRMTDSSILIEDEWIDLILNYEIRMPFPVLGVKPLARTLRCRRRAWIGKDGKNGEIEGGHEAEEDKIVYIGKNSTRYHQNRNCHYLDNTLLGVAYDQVDNLRNESGGKYHACRVCAAETKSGNTVYIMPNGGSFHATKVCTAIIAYARAVRLSEVAHLGACSYCSN